MSRWNLVWLLGIVSTYLIGYSISLSAPQKDKNVVEKHENIRLVIDVLEEVQNKYVKEMNKEQMRELVENMINGGLEKLDPHSAYINADEYKQFMKSSRGKFGGIGIKIGVDRGNQLFVESPMMGTPAYEAGIQAGDIILKIDDVSTENMPLKKAVEMITGDPGQKVTLTVLHEGDKKPVDIPLVRAEIIIESVVGDIRMEENLKEWDFMLDKVHKIAFIRITAFTETTVKELAKVVDQLQKDGVKGVILDLRTNPGGLLRAAVEVSELFLPKGTPIVTTKGRNHKEEAYVARGRPDSSGGPQTTYPIAILLNRYSASASEIVAAALQDAGRAIIIGERSYGKGSVQNVILMEGGTAALKLTTASYWRPNGKNIHRFPDSKESEDWGVKPNAGYEVKLSDEERIMYLKWRRHRDVVRAKGGAVPKIDEKDKVDPNFKDQVVEKAKEYILGELSKNNNKQGAAPAAIPQTQNASVTPPVGPAAVPPRMNALAFRQSPLYFGRDEP
jgi:carboxyl-terminal processing protease